MEIIVVSGKTNKTVNIRIKFALLILTIIIITAILILFVYNMVNFAISNVDQYRLVQLREENKIVHQELARIEKEVLGLNRLIDTLELYDEKLRTYASLEPINEDLRSMGVGGYTKDYDLENMSTEVGKNLVELSQTLDNLLARAQLQKESFDFILIHLEEKKYLQKRTPSIMPVLGWFIRGFGYHTDPFTGKVKMHQGLDIAATIGTPIVAPADGYVDFAGEKSGFGLTLEINHGYGFKTIYAHCQRFKVDEGDKVKRGEIIAYVGNTGKSTGPHLHYEIRISQTAVNPVDYIITAEHFID